MILFSSSWGINRRDLAIMKLAVWMCKVRVMENTGQRIWSLAVKLQFAT